MTATQSLEVLTSYSMQVLLVILACKLLERAVARSSDRCALWNTCFFSVLVLGCAALLLPRLHLIQPWSRLQPQTLITVSATQAVMGRLLLAIWCIGASVSLVRWLARGHQLRQSLRRCERLPADQVQLLLGLTSTNDNSGSLPVLLISDDADGPFCWQLHQPTVVLPRFLLEGSREDLRHVLVHELEHLKTNHPFQHFLQHLAQVVCWFHPAVWKAGASASLMREFACDEAASAHGANSAAYLRTLLLIAERCEHKKKHASAIAFGRTQSEIILRARRLVELAKGTQPSQQRSRLGRRTATAFLLLATCSLSLVWIPCDPLASSRSFWSPWPTWTAQSLHCFGCCLRDYEQFDRHTQMYELSLEGGRHRSATQESLTQVAGRK